MANPRLAVIVALIIGAGLLRLVPHPPNFAPIAAMALFAGAYFGNARLAFLVPLAAMLLSDLVLGFHSGILVVYVCMAIAVVIGMQLRGRIGAASVGLAALASAVVFFVVTNFGVWATSGMYPISFEGLVACYVAAIPFFHNTLLGDFFFAAVLFGGFALIEHVSPGVRRDSLRAV